MNEFQRAGETFTEQWDVKIRIVNVGEASEDGLRRGRDPSEDK